MNTKQSADFGSDNEKTLVEWDARYAVGIPPIDEQHRELIDLTNKLYEACLMGDEAATVIFKQSIHKVVDYIKYHFSAEETMLQNIKYPDFISHKKEHESLVKRVLEDVQLFQQGKHFIPNSFVRMLKEWILTHIAMSDKRYGDYIMNLKKQGKLGEALAAT